jgi:hypothetical protein
MPLGTKKTQQMTPKEGKPSLPSASPHHAGHYSGLHPEDQPYQSNIMTAQHVVATRKHGDAGKRLQPEPEHIQLLSSEEIAAQRGERRPLASVHARKPALSRQTISILLTLSCLISLLTASILAFALIRTRSSSAAAFIKATPDSLRANDLFTVMGSGFAAQDTVTFTYDDEQNVLNDNNQPLHVQTDSHGAFSVIMRVAENWTPGVHTITAVDATQHMSAGFQITVLASSSALPVLTLSQTTCIFPTVAAGVISSQSLILQNTGGSQLSWQVKSDQPWLAANPGRDTFSGSERIFISVDRTNLAANAYIGHLSFTVQGSHAAPVVLTVRMGVAADQNDAPTPSVQSTAQTSASSTPQMDVSPLALHFTTVVGQSPAAQSLTIQNSGDAVLNWTANSDQGSWLSTVITQEQMAPGEQDLVKVSVNSTSLNAGTYQGTLTFTAGSTTEKVAVTLTVTAPAMKLQTTTVQCVVTPDSGIVTQQVSLTNTGNASLNWQTMIDPSGNGIVSVTPAQGSLAAGKSVTLIVAVNATQLTTSSLNVPVTVSGNDNIPSQQFAVQISTAQAELQTSVNSVTFTNGMVDTQTYQPLMLKNTGSATVSWTIAQPADSSVAWLSSDQTSGQIAPGASTTIELAADSSNLSGGIYHATLDVSDSASGTVIKTIAVTLAVQ